MNTSSDNGELPQKVEGLPVPGYQPQSETSITLVRLNKEYEERLLRRLDDLAATPFADKRWVAIARTHIELGLMAMNRSIFQPQRIALPEDGEAS